MTANRLLGMLFSVSVILFLQSCGGEDIVTKNVNTLKSSKSCVKCDLGEADLSGEDLSGADLRDADLSRADFRGTNLTRANLTGANLTRANLTRADLTDADLSNAKLTDYLDQDDTATFCRTKMPAGTTKIKNCK